MASIFILWDIYVVILLAEVMLKRPEERTFVHGSILMFCLITWYSNAFFKTWRTLFCIKAGYSTPCLHMLCTAYPLDTLVLSFCSNASSLFCPSVWRHISRKKCREAVLWAGFAMFNNTVEGSYFSNYVNQLFVKYLNTMKMFFMACIDSFSKMSCVRNRQYLSTLIQLTKFNAIREFYIALTNTWSDFKDLRRIKRLYSFHQPQKLSDQCKTS